MKNLLALLKTINKKGYKAYKQLKDTYRFDNYDLTFDHVQGDPFALPTRISIRVSMKEASYPFELWSTQERKTASEDFLGRALSKAVRTIVKGNRGIGKSGEVAIESGSQQILVRNAVIIEQDFIEARFTVGLPSAGRTILGQEAIEIFFNELPEVVNKSLIYANLADDEVKQHVESFEDQSALRDWLSKEKLVAFIKENSILPRHSGIDDRPLKKGALPFETPESLLYEADLPNAGKVRGMGIPEGVTLIVGGGFHGKSTLLRAIELGVYNHIPGDGREKVVAVPTAVKIRSEDGRSISNVNISPFIDRLPFEKDTSRFNTENASGSTSQAANIIEAIECGCTTLLIDEDTSATNFMIRDERMQALVTREKEPITPFLHRVRELYKEHGISTIIVMGGSGDYFDVADTVIMMDAYRPIDVTAKAKQLCSSDKNILFNDSLPPFGKSSVRKPGQQALDASKGRYDSKIDIRGLSTILYGKQVIDLSSVEQLVDECQTRAIGLMIQYYARHFLDNSEGLREGLEKVFKVIKKNGLDTISPYKAGNLAMPRLYEVAAAINRIRARKWY